MKRIILCTVVVMIVPASTAAAQDLVYPRSVAVDGMGNIYIADAEARAIFKVDARAASIISIARAEAKYPTPLYRLSGIAVATSGEIAVSDAGSSSVYRLIAGKPVPVGDPNPAKSPFGQPQALAFDGTGDLIVPDLTRNTVFRVTGQRVAEIATVSAPTRVCLDKAGNIVVVSASQRKITRIDRSGKSTSLAEGAPFEYPLAIAAYPDGGYVVADGYAKAVFKVTSTGRVAVLVKGGSLNHPNGIAVEPDGNIVVVDPQAKALFRITVDGKVSPIRRWK
jgi:DNA-binding beta-propeller fold protein YncE